MGKTIKQKTKAKTNKFIRDTNNFIIKLFGKN